MLLEPPETPAEPIEQVEVVAEETVEEPAEETTPVETLEEIPEFTGVIEGTEAFKQKILAGLE